jgi:hypothetical protein
MRKLRDTRLAKTGISRRLTELYYRCSPEIAALLGSIAIVGWPVVLPRRPRK